MTSPKHKSQKLVLIAFGIVALFCQETNAQLTVESNTIGGTAEVNGQPPVTATPHEVIPGAYEATFANRGSNARVYIGPNFLSRSNILTPEIDSNVFALPIPNGGRGRASIAGGYTVEYRNNTEVEITHIVDLQCRWLFDPFQSTGTAFFEAEISIDDGEPISLSQNADSVQSDIVNRFGVVPYKTFDSATVMVPPNAKLSIKLTQRSGTSSFGLLNGGRVNAGSRINIR